MFGQFPEDIAGTEPALWFDLVVALDGESATTTVGLRPAELLALVELVDMRRRTLRYLNDPGRARTQQMLEDLRALLAERLDDALGDAGDLGARVDALIPRGIALAD